MRYKLTKILVLVGLGLLCQRLSAQAYVLDPNSVHLEQTAANWRTCILSGMLLSGSYRFVRYEVALPPLEVGVPIQIGPDDDPEWIMRRTACEAIAWAADVAAYTCAQHWVADRSYYTRKGVVYRDFKAAFLTALQTRLPGARAQYEGRQTPDVPYSVIRYEMISYQAYLLHVGI